MLSDVKDISQANLLTEVMQLKSDGYRFVTMTCCDTGDAHDILYHFDKNYALRHLRLKLARGATLPSISALFFAAVLVENEIKDLFGIDISSLAVDFKGRFILSDGAPTAPLNKTPIGIGMDVRVKTPAPAEGAVQA
jgi:Ni,Fe-hydrogenase III component G